MIPDQTTPCPVCGKDGHAEANYGGVRIVACPRVSPGALVNPCELIGPDEVLRICGWKTRKTIGDQRDFPAPVAVVSRMRLWTRTDIEQWKANR